MQPQMYNIKFGKLENNLLFFIKPGSADNNNGKNE